jgi:hypothetical protein
MKGLAFNAGPCFFSSNIFSTLQVLSSLFFQIRNHFFNDITSGICGPYAGYATATGWDFCTGIGTPKGKTGK